MSSELIIIDEEVGNQGKIADVSEEDLSPKKERLDGSQCQECNLMISKYNCPKCGIRTCSLQCCRDHKEKKKCDGIRPMWTPVPHNSSASYNGKHVSQDKHFIHTIKHALNNLSHISLPRSIADCLSGNSFDQSDGEERVKSPDDLDQLISVAIGAHENTRGNSEQAIQRLSVTPTLAPMERILLTNATARRIWLTVKDKEDSAGSHYDINADTIFWTITIKFMRNLGKSIDNMKDESAGSVLIDPDTEEGEAVDDGELLVDETDEQILSIAEGHFSVGRDKTMPLETQKKDHINSKTIEESVYTVKNIPDTLTVSTLLRQFLKPKENGPLISKADLNMDKMQAFSEEGIERLIIYMKVPCCENDRYYIVDPSKSLLENLRNRFVNGHPVLLVTKSNEFEDFVVLSEAEAQELHENRRVESREQNRNRNFSNYRGSSNRGERGWHRNGGGRPSGSRNHQNFTRHEPRGQDPPIIVQGKAVHHHLTLAKDNSIISINSTQSQHNQAQSFRQRSTSRNQPFFQRRNNFAGRGCNQWTQNCGNRNFNGRGFERRDNNSRGKRFYDDLDNLEESSIGLSVNQKRHCSTNQTTAFQSPLKQNINEQKPSSTAIEQSQEKYVDKSKNCLQVLSTMYCSP